MKTVLTLAFVALLALLLYNRQRVYVRDPLAAVYRNDLRETGVAVYINFSNDVLVQRGDDDDAHRILIQNWNRMPGTPERLTCLRWSACLAESDEAPAIPLEGAGKAKYDPRVGMSSREVTYVDPSGATVRIELR